MCDFLSDAPFWDQKNPKKNKKKRKNLRPNSNPLALVPSHSTRRDYAAGEGQFSIFKYRVPFSCTRERDSALNFSLSLKRVRWIEKTVRSMIRIGSRRVFTTEIRIVQVVTQLTDGQRREIYLSPIAVLVEPTATALRDT